MKNLNRMQNEALSRDKESLSLNNLHDNELYQDEKIYSEISSQTCRNSEKPLEIQGPITRRKEYQIMQISLNKFQDSNNIDNSLLKKFDDFFKDNKNIENEMYFYRKPRVDKILFQAEVLENKLSSKNIVEKNEENSVPNENSSDDYFENNTDFGEMIKEKNFNEENEKKKCLISRCQKELSKELITPIIDLEDVNAKMEIDNSLAYEVNKENKEEQTESQDQNKKNSFNCYLENKNFAVQSKHTKNEFKKLFDYSKINRDDLNYYLKFVEFYKNSQDFGNIILKGCQDFELQALELLHDCNYNISLALKQILYPIVDFLEDDESEKDFDYSYYFNNSNYCLNSLKDLNVYYRLPNRDVNRNFDQAPGFRETLSDIKDIPHSYPQKLTDSEFNQIENNCSYSNSQHYSINYSQKIKKEADIYVNSALNDLIGSNMHEKSQWYQHVKSRLTQSISSQELQELIGIAKKMKIEIPDFVLEENEKSFIFSKTLKKQLNMNPNLPCQDKNTLSDLINLLQESRSYKVRFEEFYYLEEVIKKANLWTQRAIEIEHESVNYKALQNLYIEGKNLPVKLDNFEQIKVRYLNAHQWQEKYGNLPKHSKTRNQNYSQERCKISHLYNLLQEAEKINFSSNEFLSLKTNYEKLREYEERIFLSFEDEKLVKLNKDILQEFINLLDTLKFTTETYDFLQGKLAFLNWQENKQTYLSSKSLKMKHLRNLLKDAIQKNLNNLREIKIFAKQTSQLEEWLEKIGSIFYRENEAPSEKIPFENLMKYYSEGKEFELKPEEIEHLLEKCEQVIDFVRECEEALEGKKKEFDFSYLQELKEKIEKLNVDCETFEKIKKLINDVLEWIENYKKFKKKIVDNLDYENDNYSMRQSNNLNLHLINDDNKSLYDSNSNNTKYNLSHKNSTYKKKNNNFVGCNIKILFEKYDSEKEKLDLETRHKMIEMLEDYVNINSCFYEHLNLLIESASKYVKNGIEFQDLIILKANSDIFMNKFIFSDKMLVKDNSKNLSIEKDKIKKDEFNNILEISIENSTFRCFNNIDNTIYKEKICLNSETSIDDIIKLLFESQKYCPKINFIRNLINLYKSQSWSQLAKTENKKNLSDAEAMLKEANSLYIEKDKLDIIKSQVQITKDWIKVYKKISISENFNYENLKTILEQGEKLPLISEEIKELKEFLEGLEIDINKSIYYINNKDYNFDEFKIFVDKINQYAVNIPEFKIIEVLKDFTLEWRNIANKILHCRKLCTLYFKPKLRNNINLNIYNKENQIIYNKNTLDGDYLNNVSVGKPMFLNAHEIIKNNFDNISNNIHPCSDDFNKNKDQISTVITMSKKKRNRVESKNKIYSSCYIDPNNLYNINYNKDSVSNVNENNRSKLKAKSHYMKKKNSRNTFDNNKNKSKTFLENPYSREYSGSDLLTVSENVNFYKLKEKTKLGKNKLNFKNKSENKNLNGTTNISEQKDINSQFLLNDSYSFIEKNIKYKDNLYINGSSKILDFSVPNSSYKKLKKAEQMQYENVLSVINSMPIKEKNIYSNSHFGKNKKNEVKINFDRNLVCLGINENSLDLTNKIKTRKNSKDEAILNLDECRNPILNTSKSNNEECISTYHKTQKFLPYQTPKRSSNLEHISAKKFQTLSYQDQLNLISCSFDLKEEDSREIYCICRRGDDSLNFMIMCENCKEWFHGICVHITKQASSKIASYICLACAKRKDISISNYHGEFLNYKRVEYSKFLDFLSEYDFVLPNIYEYEVLLDVKYKIENWMEKYKQLLRDLLQFCKNNMLIHNINNIGSVNGKNISEENFDNFQQQDDIDYFIDGIKDSEKCNLNNVKFLLKDNVKEDSNNCLKISKQFPFKNTNKKYNLKNQIQNDDYNFQNNIQSGSLNKLKNLLFNDYLEKRIINLYLESEGFPIDNVVAANLILILKYQDWFKDAFKCMEAKKFSEKLNKRVITNFKSIFEMSPKSIEMEKEKELFDFILTLAEKFNSKIYHKYMEFIDCRNQKFYKEKNDLINQLKLMFEINENLKDINENQRSDYIKNQINLYFKLKDELKHLLNEKLTLADFEFIYNKIIKLNFKNGFIEKLKCIYKNFDSKRFDYYKLLMFGDGERYKRKKEQLEKRHKFKSVLNEDRNLVPNKKKKSKNNFYKIKPKGFVKIKSDKMLNKLKNKNLFDGNCNLYLDKNLIIIKKPELFDDQEIKINKSIPEHNLENSEENPNFQLNITTNTDKYEKSESLFMN